MSDIAEFDRMADKEPLPADYNFTFLMRSLQRVIERQGIAQADQERTAAQAAELRKVLREADKVAEDARKRDEAAKNILNKDRGNRATPVQDRPQEPAGDSKRQQKKRK